MGAGSSAFTSVTLTQGTCFPVPLAAASLAGMLILNRIDLKIDQRLLNKSGKPKEERTRQPREPELNAPARYPARAGEGRVRARAEHGARAPARAAESGGVVPGAWHSGRRGGSLLLRSVAVRGMKRAPGAFASRRCCRCQVFLIHCGERGMARRRAV